MPLFDSHCHLTDERFDGEVSGVLERARAAGVEGVVTIASDLDDAVAARGLAEENEDVWCTAGIHPHVSSAAPADARIRLQDLVVRERVVAIGETGLDYHYDNSPRGIQRRLFSMQLELADELAMPLVVHSRDADEDTRAAIRETGPGASGVLHCFTGGSRLLDAALEAGWFVSFSGLVTFPKYADAGLLRAVPDERILIETDSPYLAPIPERGKRNEPAFVVHTCTHAARLRDTGPDSLAELTTHNAKRFYRLP